MLIIHKAGMQTTVQDLGRSGLQKYGVVVAGAMDPYALRMANLLVGNDENAAALEITLVGPEIQFEQEGLISICGADFSPQLNGVAVGLWRPIDVQKGQILSFGTPRRGSRAYLAVAGGIRVPEIMGSRSTYLRAKLGGANGRALESGDQLAVGERPHSSPFERSWFMPPVYYSSKPEIRVTAGRQVDLFTEDSRQRFFSELFTVSSQSDRMGYRLNGPQLALSVPHEMQSEAVAFGSIQVPPDGNPIILMADRQTTGGYPKIAEAITVDLPLISQLKPGERLRFTEVSIEEAQHLLRVQEQTIRCLKKAIRFKGGYGYGK